MGRWGWQEDYGKVGVAGGLWEGRLSILHIQTICSLSSICHRQGKIYLLISDGRG